MNINKSWLTDPKFFSMLHQYKIFFLGHIIHTLHRKKEVVWLNCHIAFVPDLYQYTAICTGTTTSYGVVHGFKQEHWV